MDASQLWLSWGQAGLVIVSAIAIYVAMITFSRVFKQRQFSSFSAYDLAFTFALGTLIGRVILVRTSLGAGVLGLSVLFTMHTVTRWLHHRVRWFHDLVEATPVMVVRDGRVLPANLRRAGLTEQEIYQQLRLRGHGSLAEVRVAVLERNGALSIISADREIDADVLHDVARSGTG